MRVFEFTQGTLPLLITFPHSGTQLTSEVSSALTPAARALPDTTWHMDKLFQQARKLGAGTLTANYNRLVIDLDCPTWDRHAPAIWPTTLYDGCPCFIADKAPTTKDRIQAFEQIWKPWHQQITSEMERLTRQFGYALLLDVQTLSSQNTRMFGAKLADINLGSLDGTSCPASLLDALTDRLAHQKTFSYQADGLFKGAYTNATYGKPLQGWYALQLMLTGGTYMDEQAPYRFSAPKAAKLQPVIDQLLAGYLLAARELKK